MPTTTLLKVNVDHTSNGAGNVEVSDRREQVECEMLEDAKRLAACARALRQTLRDSGARCLSPSASPRAHRR